MVARRAGLPAGRPRDATAAGRVHAPPATRIAAQARRIRLRIAALPGHLPAACFPVAGAVRYSDVESVARQFRAQGARARLRVETVAGGRIEPVPVWAVPQLRPGLAWAPREWDGPERSRLAVEPVHAAGRWKARTPDVDQSAEMAAGRPLPRAASRPAASALPAGGLPSAELPWPARGEAQRGPEPEDGGAVPPEAAGSATKASGPERSGESLQAWMVPERNLLRERASRLRQRGVRGEAAAASPKARRDLRRLLRPDAPRQRPSFRVSQPLPERRIRNGGAV